MGPQARQNRSLLMQLAWTIYRNRLASVAVAKEMVEADIVHSLSNIASMGYALTDDVKQTVRSNVECRYRLKLETWSFPECLKRAWAKTKAFEPAALIRKAEIAERREMARYIDDPIFYAREMNAIRQMEAG